MAFQIRDDMLDVIGDAGKLGKAVGVDGKKNTLVRIYGVDHCDQLVTGLTLQAKAVLKDRFTSTEFMMDLADWLTNRTY